MPLKKKRKGPAPGTVYSNIKRTEIGQRIVTLRLERGMSQSDLAKKTGLTKRMISFYEVSAVAIPIERLTKIAVALSVSLDELAKLQPLTQNDSPVSRALLKRLDMAKQLPEAKQKLLIGIIDEMCGKKE